MTTMAVAPAAQFPVTYFQEHPYKETREKLVMLTGLPESATVQELAEKHAEVVRKQLGRGQHIPQVLVWNPDPSEFDFPTKKQASLMDELIKREHNTIPIEIQEVSEEPDGIAIVYRVRVTEEQLLEEEERDRLGPGPEPGSSTKLAELPVAPMFLGAIISGAIGYWLMPKDSPAGPRLLVTTTLALLGGTTVAVAVKRKQEAEAAA